jgi:hypothetical protein
MACRRSEADSGGTGEYEFGESHSRVLDFAANERSLMEIGDSSN